MEVDTSRNKRFRQVLAVGVLLLIGCSAPAPSASAPALSTDQAWQRWNSAMTKASELVAEMDAMRDVVERGFSDVGAPSRPPVAAHSPREIAVIAMKAVAALAGVSAPPGAEGYRAEFIRLYRDRGSIEEGYVAAIDAAGPFRFCVPNPRPTDAAYCAATKAAQETRDVRLSVWRKELTDLRTRYNSWLVTQAR